MAIGSELLAEGEADAVVAAGDEDVLHGGEESELLGRCGAAVAQRSPRLMLFTASPTRSSSPRVAPGCEVRKSRNNDARRVLPQTRGARRSSFSTPGAEGGSRKHRPSFSGGALPQWVDGSSHYGMAPPPPRRCRPRRRRRRRSTSAAAAESLAAALAELDALGRRSVLDRLGGGRPDAAALARAAAAAELLDEGSTWRLSLAEQRRVDPEGGGLGWSRAAGLGALAVISDELPRSAVRSRFDSVPPPHGDRPPLLRLPTYLHRCSA